jgi:hypothetical protein
VVGEPPPSSRTPEAVARRTRRKGRARSPDSPIVWSRIGTEKTSEPALRLGVDECAMGYLSRETDPKDG